MGNISFTLVIPHRLCEDVDGTYGSYGELGVGYQYGHQMGGGWGDGVWTQNQDAHDELFGWRNDKA